MSFQTPKRSQIETINDRDSLGLSAADLDAIEPLMAGLAATASLLPRATPATVPTGREVLERPAPEEDPCNAIRERCRVPAEGDGPLSGWRIGVKDTISVAGVPLSCGSRLLEGFVPRRDATVVSRMLAAGAEIVATLNMDDMAVSASGDTSAFGPVLNPHDRARLAGGSSGGSAAALSYEGFDATLGGDQGGSIRIPASWCGAVGLKPTFSLVPYTGVVGADASFDHVGPMAADVERVALLLDVIAGPDEEDPRQRGHHPAPALPDLVRDTKTLRIGLLDEGFEFAGMDPAVADCVRDALGRGEGSFASQRKVSIPEHRVGGGLIGPLLCEGVAALIDQNGVMPHLGGRYDPELAEHLAQSRPQNESRLSLMGKAILLYGRFLREHGDGSVYARSQNARSQLRRAYDAAFEDFDLLAMPTTPTTAPVHRPDASAGERLLSNLGCTANTGVFDLSGHPAISLPCGSIGGLPVGLMLVGRAFEDATVLRAARALEAS